MRMMIRIVGMLCIMASVALGAEDKTVEMKGAPLAVTVYTGNLARVTREGLVEIPAGECVVRTSPLPNSADLSSVQVSIVDAPGCIIDAVETRSERLETAKDISEAIKAHQEKIQAQEDVLFGVEQELQLLQQKRTSLSETLNFLQQLRSSTAKLAGEEKTEHRIDTEGWEKAISLAEARAETTRTSMIDLNLDERLLRRKLNSERETLNVLRRKSPRYEYVRRAYIRLRNKEAVAARVQVIYTVAGAKWDPSYRVRAGLKEKKMELDVLGSVKQTTGEDWSGITLSLSTARPDIGTDIPRLTTWYLRTAADMGTKRKERGLYERSLRPTSPAKETDEVSAYEWETHDADSEPMPEGVESAGVATVFTAQTKAEIPSDNQHHLIPVATIGSDIELEHVAIPKIQPYAFLKATCTNTSQMPLPSGRVEVMVDGSFVGRGAIETTAPGQKLELGLGVDENVKVKIRLAADEVERHFRGDRVTSTNTFEIVTTNFGKEEVSLTVYDQIPISKDPNVTIDYDRDASRALRGAEFPGQLSWNYSLAPGKQETISFGFSIDYPKNMTQILERLNRATMQEAAGGNKNIRQMIPRPRL